MKTIVVTRMRYVNGQDEEVSYPYKGEKFIVQEPAFSGGNAWLVIYDEKGDVIVQTRNFESVFVRDAIDEGS